MKTWIKTNAYNAGTVEEPNFLPDLGGLEYTSPYSLVKINFPSEVLVRIAGEMTDINTLKDQITDEEAYTLIKSNHPDAGLENCDVVDPEIDEIAKSLGLDPHLRADIKIPSRGKQVLQDQEKYLMTHISEKKGKSKQFWDNEANKSGKYKKGIDIQNDVLDGKGAAHEFILSRLRAKVD